MASSLSFQRSEKINNAPLNNGNMNKVAVPGKRHKLATKGTNYDLKPSSPTNDGDDRDTDSIAIIKTKSLREHIAPPPTYYNKFSEAHIHRIRGANSRTDSLQSQAPSPITPVLTLTDGFSARGRLPFYPDDKTNSKKYFQLASIAEEDEDEVESLDWTSPFDITSYLYKPEYVIDRENEVFFGGDQSYSSVVVDKNDKSCLSEDTIQDETQEEVRNYLNKFDYATEYYDEENDDEEEDETFVKKKFVQDYVKRSTSVTTSSIASGRKGSNSLKGNGVPDYSGYIKAITNEIKEISLETKRWDAYSPRTNKQNETKAETKARGYVTLKRMYELNPELTETAAKRHICGPPGNSWMGLTRMEVIEVMRQIRREFGAPPRNYISRPSTTQRKNKSRLRSKSKNTEITNINPRNKKTGRRNTLRKGESYTLATRDRPKSNPPRFRASQLPVQHVPGPKHLHTNICIRPWEPDLDGWSQEEHEAATQASLEEDDDNEYDEEVAVINEAYPQRNQIYEEVYEIEEEEIPDKVDGTIQHVEKGQGDGITLEIFNPSYCVAR